MRSSPTQILPPIMGRLRQDGAEGVLVLEQNDGCRRLYWEAGGLVHLQSDVAGEQFGNYLLRQGIIDFPALNELLKNDERYRLGEKVIQWGLMTLEERDLHLRSLQEQVMIHSLEHPVLEMVWNPGSIRNQLGEDLCFRLDHRHFVWSTFDQAGSLGNICDLFYEESEWRWVAPPDLLQQMSDLPLNPRVAYALSFLGAEPIGFETFLSITGMEEGDAACLIATLWALGAISLVEGHRPSLSPDGSGPHWLGSRMELPVIPAPVASISPVSEPLPPPTSQSEPPAPAPTLEAPVLRPFEPLRPLTVPEMPEIHLVEDAEPISKSEDPKVRARKLVVKAKHLALQDRTAESVRYLEESVRLDPDSEAAYEPWLMLGRYRISNPAWSTRAIEALQAASRLNPKAAEPWSLMGDLYHRKGFKANAKACFKRALELDPSVQVPADVELGAEEKASEGLFSRVKRVFGRGEQG